MFVNKRLVLALVLVLGFVGVSAAQDDAPRCYTLASLSGTYGVVAEYGAHQAMALAVRHFDGKGNTNGTFTVNAPDPASTTGGRKLITGTNVGTYTINCDGTGVITRVLTSSTGVVTTQMDDFVITTATVKNGVLVATTMEDAVRVPSALVPGGVFVTRHYTRRPDGGGSDGDQNQQ